MKERERFGSRLGFLLISAGCAIGLGNVWRFPYIVGQYGGGAFVLVYLFFLVVMGLPIMVMEFAVGRASQKSAAASFRVLEPNGTKWHIFSYFAIAGNYLLMMFYTTVGGWMVKYFVLMAGGQFSGLDAAQVEGQFNGMLSDPLPMVFWTFLVILVCFGVCAMGLRNGVERITKLMMILLFVILIILCINSILLPGASEGLRFYLVPDMGKVMETGISEIIFAAMGQAFFTLSIGIGSMAIFGSYIGKDRSLTGEALSIGILDTTVALLSGLIIFPACSTYGVDVTSGPKLIFITLPNIFNNMPGGQVWGCLFFIFMSFAALSTIIAVFENILAFAMDLWGWGRKKAVAINLILVMVLSLPCILGFNLLSGFQPLGAGTSIQDLEDFIVSNNLLPLGSLVYLMFCMKRSGWGWENFIQEANQGRGLKFPRIARKYLTFILPVLILLIFIQGYLSKFFGLLG